MTAEVLSKIIEQSINSVDLAKLKESKGESGKDLIFAVLKLVAKDYVGASESVYQAILKYGDYKVSEFFRKYYRFLYELADTTVDQRHQFAEELQEKAEDSSGNVIIGIVDRMDNIHKEQFLARLTIARINGWISIEDFFRLSSMLERIPYVDLKILPYYKEPYYDESGDTELLYATGALNRYSINANGPSLYVLSTLGEKLMRFGLGMSVEIERKNGTIIEVDTASEEDIEEIFNQKLAEAQRKHEEKEYIESDRAMFDYDIIRGK